ncbi:zinc-dependent alcohol dehydrogenase family protein [Streptomyces sp. 8N706]|uniref:zinc-dependent alcohol dehydrogenase family protein n=1 Tax=Streptomyces sp. 8N706 TaxID=3457416 RepID=UPI003FD5E669
MRRWVLKPGRSGTDALALEQAPIPEPGPGQVRIAMKAASLNYRDLIIANGGYGQSVAADTVAVSDGAGVIDALGEGVATWTVGDRVAGLYFGGWVDGPPKPGMGFGLGSPGEDGVLAEYVVLDADRVARIPRSLDFVQASTLPCAALTAWSALTAEHPVRAGHRVLVLGTGGVSTFALVLARSLGAEVIATTSRESKVSRLRDLGAAEVINYRSTQNWGEVTFSRTGGVNKVINAAGGDAMTQSIMAVGHGGEIAVMGLFSAGDAAPPLPVLMAKGASIRGTSVGSASAFASLVDFIDAKGLVPPVHRRFAFDDARQAYEAQAAPDLFGKIVIEVAP